MSFITGKQTLDDLNLPGKYRPGSVYSLFNVARTAGGERLLEEMFSQPLSDPETINRRSELFTYFQQSGLNFPFDRQQLMDMEQFLSDGLGSSWLVVVTRLVTKKALAVVVKDENYARIEAGFRTTVEVLKGCRLLLKQLKDRALSPYHKEFLRMATILIDMEVAGIYGRPDNGGTSFMKMAGSAYLLQHRLCREMDELLDLIYQLDVFIAVAGVAKAKGYSYAVALPAEENNFVAEGLRHPGLEKGVGNSLSFHRNSNVLFLTGANMAGKSTLMKSFGIAVYLAHLGFPVAADKMRFSVRDGLYSSINVPDNIGLGYSHFYAEVRRVKEVAEAVSERKRLIVLFDELFKGTNVKDAYDATLAITEAFAGYRDCCFIVSTHIIELGEVLQRSCENCQFAYLPTIMEGAIPRYTYRLEKGITSDRQGMTIIRNEKILEILWQGTSS